MDSKKFLIDSEKFVVDSKKFRVDSEKFGWIQKSSAQAVTQENLDIIWEFSSGSRIRRWIQKSWPRGEGSGRVRGGVKEGHVFGGGAVRLRYK